MIAVLRPRPRLYLPALVILAATFTHAQESMMLRSNTSPAANLAINTGDFNNDGILDVITISTTISSTPTFQINVYLGRPDGTFAPPISTTSSSPPSNAGIDDFAIGDFNGDGKLDVAVLNREGIGIFLGNGDGTFRKQSQLLTKQVAASVTTSDFNNDGKLDLAVGETTGASGSSQIEILEGDGAGNFSSVNTVAAPDSSRLMKVRVGDFNSDGKVDIAVLQTNAISALFGNGNFTFDAVLLKHYVCSVNESPCQSTQDMSTEDVNQDGFTDILVSFLSNTTTLAGGVDEYLGTPNRSLDFHNAIAPSSDFEGPGEVVAADVNGDGINDIAALDNDSTFADGLYIWRGNADGTFEQTPTKFIYTTDRDKQALVAGDFNRDGKIDFAVGLVTDNLMDVLLNATPRAACQKNTANPSMTVCQPQNVTFSNSPLHIVAEGNSSNGVTDIDVFIDNAKKGSFASSSINKFFSLPAGDHLVVVKGFEPSGASFRSNRNVTIFSGAPGETCPSSSSTVLSVNVCLPAEHATLSSPVQIFANSYSPRPVTAIQVYIDNHLEFNDSTATEVNKLFSMSPGSHFVTVKAFDATGKSISESKTIDVK